MKQVFVFALTLLSFVATLAATPMVIEEFYTDKDFTYFVHEDKAIIFTYTGENSTIEIPTMLDDYEVVNIVTLVNARIKSITVAEDHPYLASKDGILYNKELTELKVCPPGFSGHYTVPKSVTTISGGAFAGCSGLTSVIIPSSVTNIGPFAFLGCSGLTSVILSNSITEIHDFTFADCTALNAIIIPSSVKRIGLYAFAGCKNLSAVIIPSSVKSIDGGAFSDCSALKDVIIANPKISIADDAFFGCAENLTLHNYKREDVAKAPQGPSVTHDTVLTPEEEPIYLPRLVLDSERVVREF